MNKSNLDGKDSSQENTLIYFLGDRLAQFIVARNWSPVKIAICSYPLAILSSFVISLFAGTLLPKQGYKALIQDYPYFFSEVVVPFLWFYYAWILKAPQRVVDALKLSNVLLIGDNEDKEVKKLINNKIPTYIALILSFLAASLYYYQILYIPSYWLSISPLPLAIRSILVIFPTAYVTCSLLARFLVNIRIFRVLLKNVVLHPLNPDNAGGLLALGHYALSTSYIITVAGLIVAIMEIIAYKEGSISNAYFFHTGFIIYIIFAPISFFAPLGAAHNAMRQAKNKLLLEISQQFNQDFSYTRTEIKSSAKELKDNIEKIEQLQKLYKLANDFPVWPFDTGTVRKFALSVSSPIATLGVSILIELFTKTIIK